MHETTGLTVKCLSKSARGGGRGFRHQHSKVVGGPNCHFRRKFQRSGWSQRSLSHRWARLRLGAFLITRGSRQLRFRRAREPSGFSHTPSGRCRQAQVSFGGSAVVRWLAREKMASPSGEKATSSQARGSDESAGPRAHEANGTGVSHQANVLADMSCEGGQPSAVLKVLSQCRVIYDGILNLDKKFDVIDAKVPKVRHSRVRSLWQSRKPPGYTSKNDNVLLSREVKFQKMKQQPPSAAPRPEGFPKDPSSWSVEEVIAFLVHVDPQTFRPLAHLFRYHAVDGKALLLLQSDLMMKYMGLKLGTAVKLGHYIKRLKPKKYLSR
ncbi:sex comb on midleg-like protein 1 [Tamandua tetradactyla]|uniref:sex comb on midleg-like protein 1 n=1 Tax=Tamandua tetradactyla TaxID=48850 RepID=UPI0040546A03